MARVLAITFDGILQPIGYSQVGRVVLGLARRGHPYSILSLEREAHLGSPERAELEAKLQAAGVRWIALPYAEGGGGGAFASNLRRATEAALGVPGVELIHARSMHAALVARVVKTARRVPYLFDVRGYWVDEQVNEGRRFTTPASYAVAKGLERALYSRAAGIVTLTELQAGDVRTGKMGGRREPVLCIPTCADYDEFLPARGPRPAVLAGLPAGARLVGIVGALNRSYCAEETLALVRKVLERDPRSRLVVLSAQRDEYEALLRAHRIPADRALVTSVPHRDMPQVMPHLDWAVLLLRSGFAKRGSFPTKLAELFASGVPVVQHGCNEEVSGWVRRSGGGIVLDTLDDASLDRAAARIAGGAPLADAETVRARTRDHFSLESGVRRYDEILRAVARRAPPTARG